MGAFSDRISHTPRQIDPSAPQFDSSQKDNIFTTKQKKPIWYQVGFLLKTMMKNKLFQKWIHSFFLTDGGFGAVARIHHNLIT